MTTSNQKRQPKGRPVGGRYATTEHAEPTVTLADPPAGKRTSKGVGTTVTLPNGVVAKRTSQNGNYTHAVVLPPEDPELVRQVRTARIKELNRRIQVLDEALTMEKQIVKIKYRGFARNGEDPDLDYKGEPYFHNFEVLLYAADGKTLLESSHANSKGVTQGGFGEDGEYDGALLIPGRERMRRMATSRRRDLITERESNEKALADLEAGTYDLGHPQVARWSSREDLAVKAAQGEFARYNPTRRPYVVPVDGYEG